MHWVSVQLKKLYSIMWLLFSVDFPLAYLFHKQVHPLAPPSRGPRHTVGLQFSRQFSFHGVNLSSESGSFGTIVPTYLARLFARGRHFDGEFPQEILGARGVGRTPGIVVRATCGAGSDAILGVAVLLSCPLLVLREQLALLLEELRLTEAFLEAGGALESRRRAGGRARELELVPQQVLRALVAYSRRILVAERPALALWYLAHRALTRECPSPRENRAAHVQRHFTRTFPGWKNFR